MKGLWVLGGRVGRFENGIDTMVRLLEAEAKFQVDPGRLRFLSMNRYYWKLRRQAPTGAEVDNICFTYGFEPTEGELSLIEIGLSPSEYGADRGLQEFDRDGLVGAGVHPVIIKLYDELFPEPQLRVWTQSCMRRMASVCSNLTALVGNGPRRS